MADATAPEKIETAEPRALVMAAAALAFLTMLALLIPHGGVASAVSETVARLNWPVILLFGLWAMIAVEGVFGWMAAPDRMGKGLARLALILLVPPMRMTISPRHPNTRVRLPGFGWLPTSKASVAEMETRTALPMLFVTALIVPVIVADFMLPPTPHDKLTSVFETVAQADTSDGGKRLYLLDGSETAVANFVRPDGKTSPGIDGLWLVPGTSGEEVETALSFWPDGRFSFRTGCAVTEGGFEHDGSALSFTDVRKTASCPPTALEWTLYLVTALIWWSFALEFILLVSLAPKKLEFCKRHWINIVIILLPLLAFLRSLQLFRFLRMARAGKLMRAYRLKGLGTRVAKLAVLFNLVDRMLSRNPEKYRAHLEDKIADKTEELQALRDRLAEARSDPSPGENIGEDNVQIGRDER